MKEQPKQVKLLKFYHLPDVNPSEIGFVKFEVECLHNPELSRKALDYQHRDIKDWLYANLDLKHKEETTFHFEGDWIVVYNGPKKRYRIRQEPIKVYEDE